MIKAKYFHPLFDECKCSYRFSYCLSEAMAKEDIALERQDYRGTGDSEEMFCDITLETIRQDMDSLISEDTGILIGLRFGASMIYDYICRNKQRDYKIILIEPIFSGHQYVDYLLRKQRLKDHLTKIPENFYQEEVYANFEGYKTQKNFIGQIDSFLLDTAGEIIAGQRIDFLFTRRHSSSEEDKFISRIKSQNKTHVEHLPFPDIWERIPVMDYSSLIERVVNCCHER